MSEHASPQHASKDSLDAMKDLDRHTTHSNDAVPGGAHAHSPAAHEAGPHADTKPVGDRRLINDMEEGLLNNGQSRGK